MIPYHYVWLAWSVSFLVPWLLLFWAYPRHREMMWWSSLLAVPFALSEPLFLGRYWDPPTLFDLSRVAHFDLEAFVFCFAIGGVAAVLYHAVTGRPAVLPPKTERDLGRQFFYNLALSAPFPAFGVVLVVTQRAIWAGLAGFFAGTAARLLCRPEWRAKTVLGGLLFVAYYAAFLLGLKWLAPGYIAEVWNPAGPARVSLYGLPATELLFAAGFGFYWSGLYEQIRWTLAFGGMQNSECRMQN